MNLSDDDFTILGLPQTFALDEADLQQRWKQALGQTHPDRFAQSGAAGQRVAMQWTVRLNEAYQRLKNPLKRAAYLCELKGASIDAERNTAMPAAFLMQQIQWREDLESATSATQKTDILQQINAGLKQYQDDVARYLDHEHTPDQAAQTVRAWMFLEKLLKQQ